MSKKILFMSSAKLTAVSLGLLLVIFCTIGMSFTPGDEGENVGNPNDTTYVPGPRRSHWTTSEDKTSGSGCNATTTTYYTQHNTTDYGKATAHVSSGNGTVTVSYEFVESGSYKATIDNSHTALGPSSPEAYVTWTSATTGTGNSSESTSDTKTYTAKQLEASHSLKVTFTAAPAAGYRFLGWSTSGSSNDNYKSQDDPSFTETIVIGDGGTGFGSYGTSESPNYKSYSDAYAKTYYAYFEVIPKVNVTFLPPSTALVDKGNYDVTIGGVTTNVSTANVVKQVDAAVTLTMHPKNPYMFVRWYSQEGETKTTLSTDEEYTTTFGATATIGAELQEMPTHLNMTFKAVDLDANDNPVGTYTVNSTTVGASDYVYNTGDDISFKPTLIATPTSNYVFYGWYTKDGAKKNYLSYDATWTPTLMEDITIYAEFLYSNYTNDELAQFQVGSATFFDLKAADAAASSGSNKTITLIKDGILPPGHYTISSGNTLYIPNENGTMVTDENNFKNMADQTFAAVSAYRTLTFTKGADLTVDGTLYVAAKHFSSTNVMEDGSGGPGRPIGKVGRIHMADGGHIEVNGKLFCFGFITGQNMANGNNTLDVGTITANSGSTVYENFIVGDMRGGDATYAMTGNAKYKAFPFNGYYLQNIEVPVQFNFGATEKCVVSFNPSETNATATFTIIGRTNDDAMFRLNEDGATITKWYDATTDHFCVKMSGDASLKNLKLSFTFPVLLWDYDVNINSQDYILPIPSSMHLIFDNTTLTLSNELGLLPGAIAEIRDNASITLGTNLYLYDVSQWDKYCVSKYFTTYNTPFTTHLVRKTSDMSQLEDAKMIIDGTCTISSGKYVYSTSSGANICGNGGGKLIFAGAIPSSSANVYQVYGSATGTNTSSSYTLSGVKCTVYLTQINMGAANLHNENNTYTKSISSTTFHNVHGRWFAGSAKDENASTHVHTFTYRAGENVGTATENMNAGSDATTPAVYSWDKTGVDLRQKWADVSGPVCTNWWQGKGTQSTYFYNWTMSSDWHQFTPMTSPTGWYGGSNNKLYEKSDCTWNEIGDTDENCMYTIGGVKKALVDGALIELEKNTYDEAYHDVATGENFYLCFEGCNWHPATPYPDELEAYIVIVDDTLNYIWKDGEWFKVLRDELMFYTLNEKGTKDYYDYIDNRWQDAHPRVKVVSGDQVWRGFSFLGAITQANEWNDATITVLNDLAGTNVGVTYNRANTTCTLDLNGHTVSGACAKLLTINASGSTFTITDNSEGKNGRIENIFAQNAVTYGITLTAADTLKVLHGTIHAENPAQYASKDATVNDEKVKKLDGCGARAVQVAAAQKLNISGGRLEAYATRNAFGIVATGNTANTTIVTVSGGEIYAEAPCAVYGIYSSGKVNVSAGLIEAKLNDHLVDAAYAADNASNNINKHQTCYGIYMIGSAAAAATSCYFGTLTMTGGTVKAMSVVAANYSSNVFGIDLYADFKGTGSATTLATDGSLSQKYAAKATIENVKVEVNTKANAGYGIRALGRYNSADKSTSVVKIKNTEVDVYARASAYGILSTVRISTGTGNGGCTNADVELTNCDVYAETTGADGAYGVWSSATQGAVYEYTYTDGVATATGSIYAGEYATGANLTVNGGRYEAKAKTSGAYASGTSTKQINTYSRHSGTALHQQLGGQVEAYSYLNIYGGEFIATAGTETARGVSNGGVTTIEGGTFSATVGTRYAYGFYALSGTLTASNATVTATSNATSGQTNPANGVHVEGTVAAYTMFKYAPTVTLTNLNVTATTTSSSTARALYVTGASRTQTEANKETLKTNGTASGVSSTNKNNYNNYYNIYQIGEEAIAPVVNVYGGTYTANAGTNTAYGAHSVGTSVTTNKVATASPEMNLHNATFIATTGTSTTAYGVQCGGPTLIDGCTITATAGNPTFKSTASGVRAVDKITTIKNSTITATATDAAYGLEGYVEINATHGYCWHGEFDLSEAGTTEVTAEAKTSGKKAWSVYLQATNKNIASGNFAGDYATAANATINGGTYKAIASGSGASAYCLSIAGKKTQGEVSAQPEVEVLDGFFNGATAEVGTAGVVGHMQLKGGYFAHNTNLATYAVAPKSVWTLPNTHEHYNPYYYKIAEIYTLNWTTDGDALTGTYSSGTIEAGSAITAPNTPTKTGYTFAAWSPAFTGTMPAENTTYNATWNVNNHSLTWNANGGTLSGDYTSGEVAYGTSIVAPMATRENYVFTGWDADLVSTMPDNDLTYTAQWAPAVASVTANDVTTYYATVADAFTAAKTKTNPTIKLLQDVALGVSSVTYDGANTCILNLNGQTISGTGTRLLTIDNSSANFTITDLTEGKLGKLSMNTSSTTEAAFCAQLIKGKLYLEAGTIYLYTTSSSKNAVGVRVDAGEFIMNGGSVHTVATQNNIVAHGVQPLNSAKTTINGGMVRAESANGIGSGMYVTGTITVNGGKFFVTGKTAYIVHASTIDATKVKLQGGYYNINTNVANCATAPYHVLNTTATDKAEVSNDYNYKVAEAYAVTFNANGHGTAPASQLIIKGQKATEPTALTATGYTFGGWYKEAGCTNEWDFVSDVVTAATPLYAKWTVNTHKLAWNFDGGTPSGNYTEANNALAYGSAITYPTLSKTGYTFAGWSSDATSMPDADLTITASWTVNTHKLAWNFDDGTPSGNYTEANNALAYGSTITYPTLSKTGYTFAGWSTSATSMPDADLTITASWTPNTNTAYTVKHYKQKLDGTYAATPDETDNLTGTTGAEVTPAIKDYTGFTAPSTQTVTILADGSLVVEYYYTRNSHKVTWDATTNGGSCETAYSMVKHGATIGTLPVATKTGHEFQGWFTTYTEGGNPVTSSAVINFAITYYARFTPSTYDITYKDQNDIEFSGVQGSGYPTTHTYGTATALVNPTKAGYTFDGWYDNAACTGSALTEIDATAYTADFTLYAKWTIKSNCTIRWVNYDGTLLCESTIQRTGNPDYPNHGPVPTKPGDANRTYTFIGWSPEIHAAYDDETYTAQYSMSITTGKPGTYTVSGAEDAVATTVQVSGALHIPEGNSLTTGDLIVEAYSDGSGTIDGIGNVTVTGDAYFDYEFNVDPWHWSAFGVPFEIDLEAAAPLKERTEELAILGRDDYDIVYYDTEERAANGASKNCWKYVDNETHRLIPGRLYMIAFDKHVGRVGVLRFKKAALAPVNCTTPVQLITTGPAGGNNNWNGIANPMMYHALLGAGVTECQVHDGGEIGKDGYYTYDMKDKKFFVGKAAFVQVPQNQDPVVVSQATSQDPIVVKAPRRTKASVATENRYDIQIAPSNEAAEDRLLVLAEEDKADEYVIVSDLAKAGVSPVRAQMWVDRYSEKLCKNTTAFINNKADYPLVISTPKAGEYDLFINEQPDDETMLYLTYDGNAIWNLSYGGYVAHLEKGTTTHYGLRIVRTPKVSTGIEETTIQNGEAIRKVIVDDKVYIIRNGEIYSITGQKAQ